MWHDITPINAWAVNGFIPDAKLIAAGETLLLMERDMVRSNNGGITWQPPQLADSSPIMYSRNPAVVVNTDTVYVGSNDGLYRSTDSGKSWKMVNITPDRDVGFIYNLIADKGNDEEQNGQPILYGRLGVDVIKTVDKGKSWKNVPVEIPMSKPHRDSSPHINHIIRSDGVIYASVDYNDESGTRVSPYRLSANGRTFVRIQNIPLFDTESFEPLENALFRERLVEDLQENFSGAAQFFNQLVKVDDLNQQILISKGLRGGFAVSGGTFYLEYNFKLFRCQHGDTEWYDTELEETVELTLRYYDARPKTRYIRGHCLCRETGRSPCHIT